MDSSYPDSVSSSPRSRGTDTEYPASQRWDDGNKVRFMCSYGGRILPRPNDNQLCYLGGDTRMVTVNRNINFNELMSKLSKLSGGSCTVKYQLPNEDLDALISVTTEEDLENMMEEYERSQQTSLKPARLRIFLFPAKLDSSTTSSLGSLLDSSKREHWFVDALNGTPILQRGVSEGSSVSEMPDYLFGFDAPDPYWDKPDDRNPNLKMPISSGLQQGGPNPMGKPRVYNAHEGNSGHPPPDVHSAPDSPMLETSSYGSTSSAPPGANLPPVKVKPVQEEHNDGRGANIENPFPKFDPNSQNTIMEGEPRYGCEDMGRMMGCRVNAHGMVSGPDDHGLDIHGPGDPFFRGTQGFALRTQDPRLNFDDHIQKLKNYQKPEQYDPVPPKDGKLPVSNPSEPAINKPRQNIPETAQRQIPIQEFEQLQISNKQQQQQQERQIRQEYNMQDETVEGRYDWNAKPVNIKSPEMSMEGISQPAMKKEESNSSLSAVGGVKRDGSQSSQDGDQKITNRQVQEEMNTINMGTGQTKQPERSKYQDAGVVSSPPPRERPNPNSDRRTEDIDPGSDFNYAQKDQNVTIQQTQQDHGYMPVQYEHQYVPAHYVHQGQPMSYYQMHHDPQQGDQPYVYLLPSHHGSPMLQTMSTVIRPGLGQQQGYNVPMQRNMGVAPASVPSVYSTEVMSSKPITNTMQPPTAPPLQKQPGYDSIPKATVMPGTLYNPQFPPQPNMGPAVPRYRAIRPVQSDPRMMYRPPQQVNSAPSMHPDQQYSYQHMQVPSQMGYEANPAQVYYTQNASIVNPPYQGLTAANPDLQSSAEMHLEMKGTRVSQPF
uniref:TSA: Wollemia nobilis Ref_Wollemi_Transcript_7586_3322 transcribed RNA sequence n=1 Tax=Wollemia nobilis TaxID=56998 RepID=A0A0C9S9K1_9CONI